MSVTGSPAVWDEILQIFEFLCRKTFNDAELDEEEVKARETLSNYEKEFPSTELAMVFHLILHCFTVARYWGSMTNYWM